MKINEELLKQEIKRLEHKLTKNFGKKDNIYEYFNAVIYDEILQNATGKSTGVKNRIMTDSIYKQLDKKQLELSRNVCNFYNENQFLLSDAFYSFKNMFEGDLFWEYPTPMTIQRMTEKEFKDILLSYYATFGDRIYKIVKRYIDEGRIELGKSIMSTNPACFIESKCLSNGYITVDKHNSLNVSLLSMLAHEFGHVIDSETFLFPQNKKLDVLEDILTEVPSIYFEIGLLKYLIKNRIYTKDAHAIMADIYILQLDMIKEFEILNSMQNPIINNSGYLLNEDRFLIGTDGKPLYYDSEDEFCLSDAINVVDTLKYSLGIYLSLNMNILSDGKEKEYLKQFFNFTTSRKEYSLEQLIEMLGLTIEQFQDASLIKPSVEKEKKFIKKMCNYHV